MSVTLSTAYVPVETLALEMTYGVIRNDFGDGYSQRAGDGINVNRERYQATWRMDSSAIDNIVAIFTSAAGVDSISAKIHPDGSTAKWSCDSWTRTHFIGYDELTATLRQEFDLDT